MSDENQKLSIKEVIIKHEITIAQEKQLEKLLGYHIVFLCDDSTSMLYSSIPVEMRNAGNINSSRWNELEDTVTTLAELACYFDESGFDLFFLNRDDSVLGVKNSSMLGSCFDKQPSGKTPLAEAVRKVQQKLTENKNERPILLLIATDGVADDVPAFQKEIGKLIMEPNSWSIQFLACTPDEDEVAWLNNFDKKYTKVDVMNDYLNEKKEVLAVGSVKTFNKSDYVCKALLGPIDVAFDAADEKPNSSCVPSAEEKPEHKKPVPTRKEASPEGCQCAIS